MVPDLPKIIIDRITPSTMKDYEMKTFLEIDLDMVTESSDFCDESEDTSLKYALLNLHGHSPVKKYTFNEKLLQKFCEENELDYLMQYESRRVLFKIKHGVFWLTKTKIKESELSGKLNPNTLLINCKTGIRGNFIKEFENYYGEAIMILTPDGREYFAPKHEFKIINQ